MRLAYVMVKTNEEASSYLPGNNNEEAPRYGSAAEVVRTVALGVAALTLLSALAIAIGARTGTDWLIWWPIIIYLILVHLARILIWKSCCSKCVNRVIMCIRHSNKKSNRQTVKCAVARTRYGKDKAVEKYWEEAGLTEGLVLVFVYFSAYLTGVGAVLERMAPDSRTQISVVCGILLVFYALMPVAGCVFAGIKFTQRYDDDPDDPAKYTKWLEEESKDKFGVFVAIIAPFAKKYAWCVMEGIVLKT